METSTFLTTAGIALLVGIILGTILGCIIQQRTISTLKKTNEKQAVEAKINARTLEERKTQVTTLQKALKLAHDRSGCRNGDDWSDHTEEHPEGMTRKRVAKMEAEGKAAAKARANRSRSAGSSRGGSSDNSRGWGVFGGVMTIDTTSSYVPSYSAPSVCDSPAPSVPSFCE